MPIAGAVRIEVTATWVRPAKWTPRDAGGTLSIAGQRDWATMTGREGVYGEMPAHTERADIDNVAKIVLDALESASVVTDLIVRKRWAPVGHTAESVAVELHRAAS